MWCMYFCHATKKPYKSIHRSTSVLELIPGNLCEFNGVVTGRGMRHFISSLCGYSRFCYVFPFETNIWYFSKVLILQSRSSKLDREETKKLYSNRGGEYTSENKFYENHGIIYEVTAPYVPQ